jgi:hypothetical protein
MICVFVSECVCSFDLSVIFDACARLKRGKHAHHVVYIIICVVLFDFTSYMFCKCIMGYEYFFYSEDICLDFSI